mmetsp:Transcript_33801/g.63088  ORF Transcript_33801/g.63088 Transcript_33801/m.63088 type:complete len:231 (+) Transcript_33801:3-695(+)
MQWAGWQQAGVRDEVRNHLDNLGFDESVLALLGDTEHTARPRVKQLLMGGEFSDEDVEAVVEAWKLSPGDTRSKHLQRELDCMWSVAPPAVNTAAETRAAETRECDSAARSVPEPPGELEEDQGIATVSYQQAIDNEWLIHQQHFVENAVPDARDMSEHCNYQRAQETGEFWQRMRAAEERTQALKLQCREAALRAHWDHRHEEKRVLFERVKEPLLAARSGRTTDFSQT